jgi:benzoylformate decarboxylase
MNRITGRSAFLALLKDEGVTHLFGNPGTTELPIMHALKDHPDLTYVMAMQESLVVAIADGFSRASGRLVARYPLPVALPDRSAPRRARGSAYYNP